MKGHMSPDFEAAVRKFSADHPARLVLEVLDAQRKMSKRLAYSLREAIDMIGDSQWNGSKRAQAALKQYSPILASRPTI